MSELIYRGAPEMSPPFYRGHRDLGLMMFAGVYNYAMAGLLVQSAYWTMKTKDVSAWIEIQDLIEQQLNTVNDRFNALDSLILTNQVQNA